MGQRNGRMGREIIGEILNDSRFEFLGGFEHKRHTGINKKFSDVTKIKLNLEVSVNSGKLIKEADIVIDFTTPISTLQNIKKATHK